MYVRFQWIPKNRIIKPLKTGGGRKGVSVCGLCLSSLSLSDNHYYKLRTTDSRVMYYAWVPAVYAWCK